MKGDIVKMNLRDGWLFGTIVSEQPLMVKWNHPAFPAPCKSEGHFVVHLSLEKQLKAVLDSFSQEQTEQDCDNNGGNCDDYLLESYSDEYYD